MGAVEELPPSVRAFGGYMLGRPIGAGGMATVYAARQQGPMGVGRLVAIKVMNASARADAEFRELFYREAVIATRLEHPNIVRTYEVGENADGLFMAMEFVHGAPLSALLKHGPVPVAIALRIAGDVLRALHASHELKSAEGTPLGLIHQDVTPQNVVVGYEGVSKLLDFGVARLAAVDRSRTDSVRGKPAYLAPEQIEGTRMDCRVDVFALGVVLFEMLTGRRLFARTTIAETYHAILLGEIPRVRAFRPEVAPEIDEVVARALQRSRDARFPTASAMLEALEEARQRIGLAEARDARIAEWARAVVAPSVQPEDLEREILDGLRPTIPADMPFVPAATERAAGVDRPLRSDVSADRLVVPMAGSRRTAALVAVAALAMVVLGLAFSLRGSRAAPPSSPGPRPPTGQSRVEVAPPAATDPQPLPVAPLESPPPSASEVASERAPAMPPPRRPSPSARAGTSSSAVVPAPRPATLSVWSNVWGHVLVDGVDVGTSPLKGLPVTPGKHRVTVRTSEGEQAQAAELTEGKETKLRFTF